MTGNETCPRCGATIPPEAAGRGCPRCLLEAGLGDETAAGGTGPGRSPPPSRDELAPLFPELEIERLIGHGGMGFVYEARQTRLDRRVALKILAPRFADDAAFAERFTREARAMARLSHPNIVSVFDFGDRNGFFFLIMEFVDGTNLRTTLESRSLTPEHALSVVPHICDALQYAHDKGIVHRDIKPENVLIDREGTVKIADFGLAKIASATESDATLTMDGTVMGTPQYMAPEQLESPRRVDHRADIYSLGVVFYEMLTGELPLGRFAPPSRKVNIDVRLDEVVLKALEKEPEQRFQRAAEVRTEVDSVLSSPEPDAAGREQDDAGFGGPSRPGVAPPRAGSERGAADDGVRVPQRRLCRTAVIGAVLSGLHLLFGPVGLALISPLFMFFAGGDSAPLRSTRLPVFSSSPWMLNVVWFSGLLGLLGLGFSIRSWIVIARSRGQLYGLWLAVPGTLAPILCSSPLLSVLYLMMVRLGAP